MAIIYSYPLNTPKRDDLLIGTITYDEDAVNPVHGNPTVSFTVGSLLDLIASQGAAQNLQQVTNIGNTTTNSIIVSNSLKVSGGYYDSSNQPGTSGQLLSSTATGTQWVNVAAQGVTSVGLSMPAAFTVANSPITQAGVLAVTGAGTAAQYINGLGNLVTFPTIPTQYVLPVATTVALGGIKIGYTQNAKNYPVVLSNEQAYVNVPWTDTPYVLPLAADGTRGGVQIGYVENAKNYPVELSSEKMFVNVPWTDTPYVLPVATSSDLGGVKIGYTENAKNYPVELDSDQMYVNVPWTDTQNPFQTITGTGSDNTDSGVLLSNSGGTVLILGDGSVTAAQTGNTITLTGTDTGVTGVTLATADSAGAPLVESIANRELTLTSAKYIGGANVGYVPEGGTSSTYLKGDGTWEAIPTGLIFKGTWDASGGSGGSPDLTLAANKGAGFLWICDVAGTAYPNGGTNEPSNWNLGDWCVYDGTAWTRVPATNSGVTSLTTTDGTFIDLTPDTATTGAVTVTADLSAADGSNTGTSQRFLTKNNTWAVPAYTTDTNTQNIYTNSWQQSTNDIILRKVLSGAGSGTQDIKIVKGANITFTYTDADNFTIAATDTQENTTWYIRDSADADKTVNNLKYLKFVTATGTLGTALTGAGSTTDPYLMTLTSPDTNTQNTYTAGTGLGLSSFEFSANVNATAQSTQPEAVSTDSNRTYAVQVDDTNDKLVVNVPWSSGGTYNWTIKDNATNPASSVVDSGESIQFVTATGALGTALTEPSAGNFVMTLTSPNTTYSNFTAASSSAAGASGLVVAPPAGAQGKFLRGDATWVSVPQGDITEIKVTAPITGAATSGIATIGIDTMGAATATVAGTKGAVPASAAGDEAKFLRADATWVVPTDNNTWNANTKTVPGYVAAPGAVASKVWKTDASGNPAWRDDATGDNTTYSIASGNTKVITLTGSDSSTSAVTFADGSDISISGNNGTITIASTYALPLATSTVRGGIKIGYTESGKNYPVELSSEKAYVNVPWEDNNDNTTYSISIPASTTKLRLTGANPASTDDVEFVGSGITTVSRTNASKFTITSTEADTLATVTGRGATTTTKSYFNGDLEVNDTITVKRTGSNNGKISIEGNPPLLELKNYDAQTASDQLLSSIEFYGSDTSSSNIAGVRASINCNTGFDDPTGTSNRNQGCLEFATYNGTDVSNSPLQRLKITPDGGFSFGNTSTAYGTSGQLLQSNGDAPPTWEDAPAGGVSGSGTTNTVPRWSSSSGLGDGPLTFVQNSTATWESADTIMGGRLTVGNEGTNSVDSRIAILSPTGNESYLIFSSAVPSVPADSRNYTIGIDASDSRKFKITQGLTPSSGNERIIIESGTNNIADNNIYLKEGGVRIEGTNDEGGFLGIGNSSTSTSEECAIHMGNTNHEMDSHILMRSKDTGTPAWQNWIFGLDYADKHFKIGDGVVLGGNNTYLAISPSGSVGIGTEAPVGSFIVKDGNVNALFVTKTSCGNVGIKTTSPNASLVVKGNISYTYTNYTNVANTWVSVISMAGYPSGLYQISIMKQTNASSYITAIIKWDSTAPGNTAGSIVNTIASNQLGVGFNGSTTLQAISGLSTGTAMSANLKCLVKYEAACI